MLKEPFKYYLDYYGKSKNWLWKHQFQKNQKLYKSLEKINWKIGVMKLLKNNNTCPTLVAT